MLIRIHRILKLNRRMIQVLKVLYHLETKMLLHVTKFKNIQSQTSNKIFLAKYLAGTSFEKLRAKKKNFKKKNKEFSLLLSSDHRT